MSLKILVTDTHCALGRALEHDLEREHCQLLSPPLDWTQEVPVSSFLQINKPDIVINTFAWEERPSDVALEQMAQVANCLARPCAAMGVPLIQLSSYRVFGNDAKNSHSEKDTPAPLSPVGQAFFAAEQAVAACSRHIILRLGWVIGSLGENHLTRLLDAIQHCHPIQLNTRLRGAPTLMSDATRVIIALVKQISCGAENWGVMHYCSGDVVSEDEFAEQLVQLLAQQQLLREDASFTLTDQVPEDEPLNAVLGCRRIRDTFGVQARSWRPSLLPLVKQWLHTHPL